MKLLALPVVGGALPAAIGGRRRRAAVLGMSLAGRRRRRRGAALGMALGRRRRVVVPLALAGRAASRARSSSRLRTGLPYAAGGLALAYFLDRTSGRRRRKMAAQRASGMARAATDQVEQSARQVASEVEGVAQRAVHPQSSQEPPPDDITLARKVESEIFRPADAPKGQVNVSAENGVVSLRGQVDTPEQIEELVKKAGAVPGVRAVENLLHTPGTEAPARVS